MFHNDYCDHLYRLRNNGVEIGPRGMATREVLDASFHLEESSGNILDEPARGLNYRFMVAEWLWMMFGHSDVVTIDRYNSVIKKFSDDGLSFAGAYGPHIGAQRTRVLRKLKEDPATRQAVIEIPRPYNHPNTKDEPCTLSFQFLARDNQYGEPALHMIATMRSSDAWLGLPYDVFNFTMLQNCMAGELGLKRGWFTLRMGSSHVYERDIDSVDRLTGQHQLGPVHEGGTLCTNDLPGWPPNWLDEILMHGHDAVNGKRLALQIPAGPWARYAHALLAGTSRDALAALTLSA